MTMMTSMQRSMIYRFLLTTVVFIYKLTPLIKGVNFLRNCGAVLVGEYFKIIKFYQLS